jgi:CO/xanthine dehydrogenase FAD-binding subunit
MQSEATLASSPATAMTPAAVSRPDMLSMNGIQKIRMSNEYIEH